MASQRSDRLSDDEVAYFRVVRAQRLAADAVWQSWGGYLAQKYNLHPEDVIEEDGTIRRRPAEVILPGNGMASDNA